METSDTLVQMKTSGIPKIDINGDVWHFSCNGDSWYSENLIWMESSGTLKLFIQMETSDTFQYNEEKFHQNKDRYKGDFWYLFQ